MRFIIFALYSLSFAISISAQAVILLLYLKQKKLLVLLYLLAVLSLFVFLTVDEINYFYNVFTSWLYLQEILWVRIVYFISIGTIIYILPLLVHSFLGIRFSLLKKTGFGLLSFLVIFQVMIPYLITPLGRGVPDIILMTANFTTDAFLLVLIYVEIVCLANLKEIKTREMQSILKTAMAVLGIFILLGGFDTYRRYFNFLTVVPFFSNSLSFFIWNLASLVIFAKLFFLKQPELITPEMTSAFLVRYGITGREREIIILLAKGLANKQIAGELNISTMTVKNHIYNIFQKAGVTGRVELLHKMKEDIF
jgi:DNA-binding CsgD family transcriptional regulator